MDIEKLAEMTAREFEAVHNDISEVKETVSRIEAGQQRLESGLQKVLEVVLELPSKKVIEKLTHKVEDIDERVGVIEHKLRTSH